MKTKGVSNSRDTVAISALCFGWGIGWKDAQIGKAPFLSAGMNIDYDAPERKNVCLDEIRDSIGNGSARISRKRPIHIDAIER